MDAPEVAAGDDERTFLTYQQVKAMVRWWMTKGCSRLSLR